MVIFQELIPGLPDDIALECLIRIRTSDFLAATGVCSRWRRLLKSKEFSLLRKQNGLTRLYACLVQERSVSDSETTGSKPVSPSDFGISVFDSVTRSWDRVDSTPAYPTRLPLFCQVASTEGKLVLMGGWDPENYEPVTGVFVYDFLTRNWKQGKDMPSKRSFFAIAGLNGRVYVAGGHDPDKNGLNSACVYDLLEDDWTELTPMSQVRDECQGLIIGSEFWVISGYVTENQGEFESSAESYNSNSGEWTRIEYVWMGGQNPRSCAGSAKRGELINWAESNSDVRIGTCVVELGDRVLVSGSVSEGASRKFIIGKKLRNGKYGEFEKLVNVGDEFMGLVQSGCYLEV
ncbi:F-box/kelch-repeat protein At2g44130-like [Amaranthus tricolor]|uniref:F-box/kelch-repeat protein At2g44130-like n=1 Tax=Amaranthus tricolor TaxID=29722 RepID=UPI002588F280|nr:F-box/kelch-repeat protein At2g44130-like [Amaranthus tricolor]